MPKSFNNLSFQTMKEKGEKITMITAYDYTSALHAEAAEIDTLLVGDSLGMVMLGYEDTLSVTMEDMIHHTKAVRRGAKDAFIIADMPYMSYHITTHEAVKHAGDLITKAGANAVKLEGGADFIPVIKAILHAQIPVIGHLGLTPQSVNAFGGYKVQAKQEEEAKRLLNDAKALEEAGVSAIVLECIPPDLAQKVSENLSIPTIGIGAGLGCDGQVLVYHDVLGLYDRLTPKFVKPYASLGESIQKALKAYHLEVKQGQFPDEAHTFKASSLDLDRLY